MINPYQVLGVSQESSDEEIKKKYRILSRKYHPDANVNNPNSELAEEKFKEIQQAYRQIMDEREHGGSQGSYGWGRYAQQDFGGFHSQGSANQQEDMSEEYRMHLKAAANYINNRYYSEALNVLNQMHEKNSQWYYLSAVANAGLGNNVMAQDHARQAVNLDPYNQQYQQLLQQLESGGSWYEDMQQPYGSPVYSNNGFCMKLCLANLFCQFCFGGGYWCC